MEQREHDLSEIAKEQYSWRAWVSYPQHVSGWACEALDNLCMLLPEPNTSDRYSKMTDLLDDGLRKGLIKELERAKLRSILSNEM